MDFERLIETEQRNDDLLQRVREEAAELRRAAQLDAEHRRSAASSELAGAVAAARSRLAIRRDAALTEIRAGATATAARFDAVAEERLAAVVSALLADLLEPGATP